MASLGGKSQQLSAHLLPTGLKPPPGPKPRSAGTRSVPPNYCAPGEGVVIEAGFSIPPDVSKTCFKTKFEPKPAHADPATESARLSAQIRNFLKRSDHLEEKWVEMSGKKALSPRRSPLKTFTRSGSLSADTSPPGSCASVSKSSDSAYHSQPQSPSIAQSHHGDTTSCSSVLSDIPERESSANAEDKAKLDSQYVQLNEYCSFLEQEIHQLELLDLENSPNEEDVEWVGDTLYKPKFERCKQELERQTQKLRQMEQDHLDQIITLKKLLERKCNDSQEETEEQRQIVMQLRKRIQKLASELGEVRQLLQEETSRASVLDKKVRRFDTESGNIKSQLEKERADRERSEREKEMAAAKIEALNEEIHSLKLELQAKVSRLSALEAEMENSAPLAGDSDQIHVLRRKNKELTRKVKDQEDELEDLSSQLQSLEELRSRLIMQLEQVKREMKKEILRFEEEVEEEKNCAQKRIKSLQYQVETEREERLATQRSNKELEAKLLELEEASRNAVPHEKIQKLKKELKRTKALLKDAKLLVEQSRNEGVSKGKLRQIRHQLEDAEAQKLALMRATQKLEGELQDVLQQLTEMSTARSEVDISRQGLAREKEMLTSQVEENEEQLTDVMRKFKVAVEQLSNAQATVTDQSHQISELESLNARLKETVAILTLKIEALDKEKEQAGHFEERVFPIKVKELETRLELESTVKSRLEAQVMRLREHLQKVQDDVQSLQTREALAMDKCRKSDRQVTQMKYEISRLTQKEAETAARKTAAEKQLEGADLEISKLKNDLKLSAQRIEDLITAMNADALSDEEDEETVSYGDFSESVALSDDEDMTIYKINQIIKRNEV